MKSGLLFIGFMMLSSAVWADSGTDDGIYCVSNGIGLHSVSLKLLSPVDSDENANGDGVYNGLVQTVNNTRLPGIKAFVQVSVFHQKTRVGSEITYVTNLPGGSKLELVDSFKGFWFDKYSSFGGVLVTPEGSQFNLTCSWST